MSDVSLFAVAMREGWLRSDSFLSAHGRSVRAVFASLSIMALVVASDRGAQAQSCPADAHVDHVEHHGIDTKIVCKCNAGYQNQGGTCVSERLPSIAPGFLVSNEERNSLCERIRGTGAKYAQMKAQLDSLAAITNALDQAAADVREVRAELWQDLASDSLEAAIASVEVAQAAGMVSTAAARANAERSLTLLKSAKFGVQALSAASAPPDSKRQYTKAIDAAFSLKSLAPVPLPNISEEEWKAFNKASNTLPKLVQISERHVDLKVEQGTWPQYLQRMAPVWLRDIDDAVSAVGKLVPQVQGTHAAAHVLDGAVSLWLVRNDKDSVDQAFLKAQTARHFYQRRMGELEQLSAFYQERLGRAGMTCP